MHLSRGARAQRLRQAIGRRAGLVTSIPSPFDANFSTLARMRFDLAFDAATMQHALRLCNTCCSVQRAATRRGPFNAGDPRAPLLPWRVSLGQHSTLLRKLALNNLVRLTDEGVCSVAEVRRLVRREPNRIRPSHAKPSQAKPSRADCAHKRTDVAGCNSADEQHSCVTQTHTRAHRRRHTHARARVRTHTHARTRTHTRACTLAHARTHARTRARADA